MLIAVEKCQKKVNKCVAHNSPPMVDHNYPHRTSSQWQHRQWHTECLSKISFLCIRKPMAEAMFCTLTFRVGYKTGLKTPQTQMSKKTFGVIFLIAHYRKANSCQENYLTVVTTFLPMTTWRKLSWLTTPHGSELPTFS